MGTDFKSTSFSMVAMIFITMACYEAAPARDYDGVPSALNEVLSEIRDKVDKSLIKELDSSIRNDILQDTFAPPECNDRYGIRDGILKHNIRAIRDVVTAVIKDVQGLGQGVVKKLPLVPNLINGVAEALTYVICGAELGVSDIISGFDDGPDIFTKILVEIIELQGSAPLKNIPAGLVNITRLIKKVVSKFGQDVAVGIEEGVTELAVEVESGVEDVVNDVKAIVSGVEDRVLDVVNAVEGGVKMIGGGVGDGVGSIVKGVKGGLGDIVGIL